MIRLFSMLALLALTSVPALAERDLNYSYLEVRYQDAEVDIDGAEPIDGDGFVLGGSLAVADNLFLFINRDELEFDDGVTLDTRVLGGGLMFDIGPRVDVVFRAGLVDGEFADPLFIDDDDGYLVSAGIRALVTDTIELHGNMSRIDFDNFDEEDIATFGAEFYISEHLSVGPAISLIEDTTSISVGARLYF
ncbi:MAG: hypothetical protein AAGA84_10745 [Pseudomonadota bacterium]